MSISRIECEALCCDFFSVIVSSCGFFLSVGGEVGDSFEIANDSCEVVHVLASAFWAGFQVFLCDVSALIAKRVGNVEGEIVAALFCGDFHELPVLRFAEVFVEVAVQRASSGEVLDVASAVQAELFDDVGLRVFHYIKIGVIAVSRDIVAVLSVPSCMFHSDVFSGNHFAVEEQVFGAIFCVVVFNESEDVSDKFFILRVVADGDAEAFGGFDESVHSDGEILAFEVDVACVKEWQHSFLHEISQVLVVSHLHLMGEVHDSVEIFHVGASFSRGLLHAAVEIDGEHGL